MPRSQRTKNSVEEILIHLVKLAMAFQNHVEELRREKEGAGVEEAEEEGQRDWINY